VLLRPRRFLYKSFQKKRSIKTNAKNPLLSKSSLKFLLKQKLSQGNHLVYGQYGLQNNIHEFFLYGKYIFRIKLFLKKSIRRSNVTNRFLWIKIFPNIPITKKVIGSRMGKGKGKNSNWATKIPPKSIFVELKNVRKGRVKYFLQQVVYKLPGNHILLTKYSQYYSVVFFKKKSSQYTHFL
jgi:large subunit ribosomal protein L16